VISVYGEKALYNNDIKLLKIKI